MSTLEDLKHGLSRAWDSVTEGWREFTTRAGDALTRFNPIHHSEQVETRDTRIATAGSRWGVLPAEVRVNDEAVEVTLEVPGMRADDFSIDVHDEWLVVRGEKHVEKSRTQGQFHVMERAYGRFERALQLPVAVDDAHASASYEQGVLSVTLPRAAHTRLKRINVKSA